MKYFLTGSKDIHPGITGYTELSSGACGYQNPENLFMVREVTEAVFNDTLADPGQRYSEVAKAEYEAKAAAVQLAYDTRKPYDRDFKALEWAMFNGTEEQLTKGGTWLEADGGDGGNLGNVQTVAKKKWYLARTNLADQVISGMKEADIVVLILANQATMEWTGE